MDTTNVMHVECKEITPDSKDTRKKVASPKEPPSWIKHKIYNTRSKTTNEKYQVLSRGLASDKVAKVTLGRRSHIAKSNSQAEVDITGASLVDQYTITLVHIVGFKIINN